MKTTLMVIAAAALMLPLSLVSSVAGADLISNNQLARSLEARHVVSHPDGSISGTIVNHTDMTVRDVRLMIDYSWVWENDFKPGDENPGHTLYIIAPAAIPPHGEGSFTYRPTSPLPQESDGHFVTSVAVVGFTQMVPPGA